MINKVHEIFSPHYQTNTCWIAQYKVNTKGYTYVKFTRANHLIGKAFAIKYEDCVNSEKVSNGSIWCYAVPMEKLIELNPEQIEELHIEDQLDKIPNKDKSTSKLPHNTILTPSEDTEKKIPHKTRKELLEVYTKNIYESMLSVFRCPTKDLYDAVSNIITIQRPILEDLAEYTLEDIFIKLYGDNSNEVYVFNKFYSKSFNDDRINKIIR